MDVLTEVDFKYTVRPAVEADRRFIVETTARVRQPHGVTWFEWERYGMTWAAMCYDDPDRRFSMAHVVESDGTVLAFVLVYKCAVEMLYCKKDFRGLGFGMLLLDSIASGDPVPVRAPTDSWRMWCSKRGIKFTVIT